MRKRIRLPEMWKRSPIFGDCYEVSSLGRIRRNNKILSPCEIGYPHLTLSYKGIRVPVDLHVLICTAFHGPKPSPDHEVNHKNGYKPDNWEGNLEWVTGEQNMKHAFDIGLQGRGSDHHLSKRHLVISPEGKTSIVIGLKEFCQKHKLDRGTMSNLANGNLKRNTHKGWQCFHV